MRIVVDSNIVFSAMLKMQSKMGRILITSGDYFEFYSVSLLKEEIKNHKGKLLRLTNYSADEFVEITELTTRKIHFITGSLIPKHIFLQAEKILSGIDLDDSEFLGLALHLEARLWTGDKELINGLKKKGFENVVITTEEMFRLFTSIIEK